MYAILNVHKTDEIFSHEWTKIIFTKAAVSICVSKWLTSSKLVLLNKLLYIQVFVSLNIIKVMHGPNMVKYFFVMRWLAEMSFLRKIKLVCLRIKCRVKYFNLILKM